MRHARTKESPPKESPLTQYQMKEIPEGEAILKESPHEGEAISKESANHKGTPKAAERRKKKRDSLAGTTLPHTAALP